MKRCLVPVAVIGFVLGIILPDKLVIAADTSILIGKWAGTRELVVVGRREVNQRVTVPAELEITEVNGSEFKGTFVFHPYFQAGQDQIANLVGQIDENGVLKAKIRKGTQILELSLHGDELTGKITDGEDIILKKVSS